MDEFNSNIQFFKKTGKIFKYSHFLAQSITYNLMKQ